MCSYHGLIMNMDAVCTNSCSCVRFGVRELLVNNSTWILENAMWKLEYKEMNHTVHLPPPQSQEKGKKMEVELGFSLHIVECALQQLIFFFFFNFKPNFGSFVAALLMAVILIYQQDQQFHCKFHFVCHETCRQPGVMYAFGFFKLGFKETRWKECGVRILTSLVITSWTQDILSTSFTRWSLSSMIFQF